jgi:hypothetical protein
MPESGVALEFIQRIKDGIGEQELERGQRVAGRAG